jgi:hypothetical protein
MVPVARASTLQVLLLLLVLPAASAVASAAQATFSFASVFGDDCVLQRDAKTAVYGWGAPGLTVTVTVTDAGTGHAELSAAPVQISSSGTWKAVLPEHAAGTGFTLTASADSASIKLQRVAFGDVWFCSGCAPVD